MFFRERVNGDACFVYEHGKGNALFTKLDCDRVIEWAEYAGFARGKVRTKNGVEFDTQIRVSDEVMIDPFNPPEGIRWFIERCAKIVADINSQIWRFDITRLSTFGILKYQEGHHFMLHTDLVPEHSDRKLGVIVQLSEADHYAGGELVYGFSPTKTASKEKGNIILFPSWTPHEVKPITQGTRYAAAFFAIGPTFR